MVIVLKKVSFLIWAAETVLFKKICMMTGLRIFIVLTYLKNASIKWNKEKEIEMNLFIR